ncbi:hypothetical protein PO498_15265 [Klebsiella variicola]|uniref:hypothetical protein n=2 Tax=Klebsiella/Raoultella group TaxID=2890311 RepID=UPI001D59DB0E|nr:hypothetical protein [Klebsiella variicola]MBD0721941.1 hypothetical protein [Klebsiella variicola]HED1713357.1 hypothetical protein [Klebsiella variicola subsp. variicola]
MMMRHSPLKKRGGRAGVMTGLATMAGAGMMMAAGGPALLLACLLSALLMRPLSALLVHTGVVKTGFYREIRRGVVHIHLSLWTPAQALRGPDGGRRTRDGLIRTLSDAADLMYRGGAVETEMASWLLSEARIRRTLRQAGIMAPVFRVTVTACRIARARRVLFQGMLLLTQWRWVPVPAWGNRVRMRMREETEM